MWKVTYPVRIMQALGVRNIVITAAAGGLNEEFQTGDIILVRDHINLMPDNPLRGLTDSRLGERFPDLTTAYDGDLGKRIEEAAIREKVRLKAGTYVALQGPSLETQAECAFLRGLGADLVGMSVVPEVIVGVQAGMRIAVLSIISNMAWHPGDTSPSSVPEILAAAESAAPRLASVLRACFSIQ
jgi:purine-nucleoside phosphorylase